MTEVQLQYLKDVFLGKQRRDVVGDKLGLAKKDRKEIERIGVRELLKFYLERNS